MTQLLQQSEATAARRRIFFYLVDATDGVTPEAGVDLTAAGDIQLSKNGGAFANAGTDAGQRTEVSDGLYYYEATAAELDTPGVLVMKVTDATSRTVIKEVQVVPWDPYAADFAGAAELAAVQADVDTVQVQTVPMRVTGPHPMGSRTTNGAFTPFGASHAAAADVDVSGTWDGGTATVQVATDSPPTNWATYDDGAGPNPLTADGRVRVTGPYSGIRVALTGAGAGTDLDAAVTFYSPS